MVLLTIYDEHDRQHASFIVQAVGTGLKGTIQLSNKPLSRLLARLSWSTLAMEPKLFGIKFLNVQQCCRKVLCKKKV